MSPLKRRSSNFPSTQPWRPSCMSPPQPYATQSSERGKQLDAAFEGKAAFLYPGGPPLLPISSASNTILVRLQGRNCFGRIYTGATVSVLDDALHRELGTVCMPYDRPKLLSYGPLPVVQLYTSRTGNTKDNCTKRKK